MQLPFYHVNHMNALKLQFTDFAHTTCINIYKLTGTGWDWEKDVGVGP